MTKLDWEKAKNSRPADAASPGKKPRRKVVWADSWDDLEREVLGPDGPPKRNARQVNAAAIEAAKTPKGAWTRATLAGWGVSWPPPRGWKAALIAGVPIREGAKLVADQRPPRESAKDSIEAKLLHDVVMAITSAGLAHLLAEVPDVLAYFGGKLPTVAEVVGSRPLPELITGGITLDDKVWSFSCARTARPKLPPTRQSSGS